MPSNFRDWDGRDPFSNEKGENPFADASGKDELSDESNPYHTGATQVEYTPDDFEMFLTPRSGKIIALAIAGLGLAGAGVALLFTTSFPFRILPFGLFALAFSLPAFFKARADLRAMRKGALTLDKESGTRLGMMLAILGAVLGLAAGVAAVVTAFLLVSPFWGEP
jgi:hypothetical protein